MANPATISYANYGWETSFAAESTTYDKAFGSGVRITNLARRNNIESIFQAGTRNAQTLQEKAFEGAVSVEYVLANPWWFRGLLGATPTTSGSGPYTHTFAEANTIESFSIENNILTDTDTVSALRGCKIATAVITAEVNQLARVRLDVPFANESKDTTTAAQISESFDEFTFAHANLEFPNATTISDIQGVELAMANNPQLVYGLGSRIATNMPVKNRVYTARVRGNFEDSSIFLEAMYGASGGPNASVAETATMELLFDNGLTGTNQRQIALLFTGAKIDEHNLPQDPTALIEEELPLVMRSLQVTAINNTSAAL